MWCYTEPVQHNIEDLIFHDKKRLVCGCLVNGFVNGYFVSWNHGTIISMESRLIFLMQFYLEK